MRAVTPGRREGLRGRVPSGLVAGDGIHDEGWGKEVVQIRKFRTAGRS